MLDERGPLKKGSGGQFSCISSRKETSDGNGPASRDSLSPCVRRL